jgi:predicted short-subunit dehydrogenase-like oxidoreductase (DUF2520 family)
MKVVIIGSGNAATVLGRLIKKAGHTIIQVYSRTLGHAQQLANELGCNAVDKTTLINKDADIYIMALLDDALHEIDKVFQFGDRLVVHTAGSASIDVLKNVSSRHGVLYPLQTLRKEMKAPAEIPLLIDGNTEETIETITVFAKTISPLVYHMSDTERGKMHLMAVVVNNFTNHLFDLAYEYCKKENIDFKALYPIIDETVERIRTYPPCDVQTGPAKRNDSRTLSKHLRWLTDYPRLKYLYLKISESIMGR